MPLAVGCLVVVVGTVDCVHGDSVVSGSGKRFSVSAFCSGLLFVLCGIVVEGSSRGWGICYWSGERLASKSLLCGENM